MLGKVSVPGPAQCRQSLTQADSAGGRAGNDIQGLIYITSARRASSVALRNAVEENLTMF